MDSPRRAQLFRVAAAALLDANDEVALTAVLRDGTDANLLVNGGVAMAEEVLSQLADVASGQFLDSATGEKLRRRGWDRHRLLPKPAGAPFVDVEFSLLVANPLTFTIPVNTRLRSADGKSYTTIVDAVFPAGSVGPITVMARSELAGTSQAVGAGKLTSITSTITGSPAGLTVSNPMASSDGADEENPDDYRRRCRLEPRARARGTREAIEFAALRVPGVVRATAFEGVDASGRANRIGGLVIAGQFTDTLVRQGVASAVYESQSSAFARVVELEGLDDARAWGIHIGVFVAQVVMVSFLLRLRFRAGFDPDIAKLQAAATVVQGVNTLAPGVSIVPEDLITRLRAVRGLDVRGDEVESPAGPVIPTSPYQVLRTTTSLIQYSTAASTTGFSFNIITP